MDFKDMDISPELREKAKACTSPEELMELARREGYKLSEEELAAVSGGSVWSCSDLADNTEFIHDDDTPIIYDLES